MSRPTNIPTVMCLLCGDWIEVRPDGRGFPPDIAKRKLARRCERFGHDCEAQYRAGVLPMPAVELRDDQ